jgi:hypothetical protein
MFARRPAGLLPCPYPTIGTKIPPTYHTPLHRRVVKCSHASFIGWIVKKMLRKKLKLTAWNKTHYMITRIKQLNRLACLKPAKLACFQTGGSTLSQRDMRIEHMAQEKGRRQWSLRYPSMPRIYDMTPSSVQETFLAHSLHYSSSEREPKSRRKGLRIREHICFGHKNKLIRKAPFFLG